MTSPAGTPPASSLGAAGGWNGSEAGGCFNGNGFAGERRLMGVLAAAVLEGLLLEKGLAVLAVLLLEETRVPPAASSPSSPVAEAASIITVSLTL